MKSGNRKIIKDFLLELDRRGLGRMSKKKYRLTLQRFGNIDFAKMTKRDCDNIFLSLKNNAKIIGETKHDYWLRFRIFAKWLKPKIELGGYKLYYKKKRKLPDEMLTIDEVRKILESAATLKERAMISLLYDSGCRPHELLGLHAGDITFDGNGMVVRFNGKTGMRRIRIITTMESDARMKEYLRSLRSITPTIFDMPRTEDLCKIIRNYARRNRIGKRGYSYLFRHTRATHLVKYYRMQETMQKVYLGWAADSEMPATYNHLAGADIDEMVMEANKGIVSGTYHNSIMDECQTAMQSDPLFAEFLRWKARQPTLASFAKQRFTAVKY